MWKQLVAVAVVSWAFYWALGFVKLMGYFRVAHNHAPGPCHRVSGIEYGSEDIQALPNGLAFISSGFRSNNKNVFSKRSGRIYLFDFNKPEDAAIELGIIADQSYKLVSPHGLSLWTDSATGNVFVYVISHSPQEIVDKFRFDESTRTLTHLKRIAGDPSFHALNDLAVIDEDQFYFTNYYYAYPEVEMFLGIPWGSIGFYNGTGGTILVTGLLVPNGIALSSDNKYLYVAHAFGEEINVYERNHGRSLTFSHAIPIQSMPDNIDVDPATGDVWIGSPSILHRALAHMDDPDESPISPSLVLRIKLDANSRAVEVEEVYSNDGTEFTMSTVAVKHGQGLLIGSLASDMLYCQIK